jgi:hypothetical protein
MLKKCEDCELDGETNLFALDGKRTLAPAQSGGTAMLHTTRFYADADGLKK